ncbi:hypothetical protein [Bacillus coahuilensis]|uniref:hypothetical protein n=1 Tax=Bacillus coahuilensis TaxID=408580 RepID=UPI00018508C9|nr:hypothetical protein [Bacillus coahuilensis]
MTESKRTYYVGIASGEISTSSTDSPWDFQIEATNDEIVKLREVFDQNYSTDWQAFFRAHVPYLQYHYDRPNDAYDKNLQLSYKLIHELGNEETKAHIEKWVF